ncbi:two-component regulator propeller domain-containing protein [bacterium]
MFRFSIQILSCIITVLSFAQEIPRINFSHYTTEQGLAHNSGNCFAQDNRGFLWIGCNGGLEKFDGYKFTIYKPESKDPNSLSGLIVWSLYLDQFNDLWVGTMGGGLNKYIRDRDEFIHYNHNPDNPNSISTDNISRIFEDLSGRLWIATKGGGLNLFDRETESFTHFRNDPTNPNSLKNDVIHDCCVDHSGLIWLATENGINTFDPKINLCKSYYLTPGDLDEFNGNAMMSILNSRSGKIWIGTWRQGLFKYDLKQNIFTKYSYDLRDPYSIGGQDMYDIFEDSFGDIWCTTEAGLHKYIPESDRYLNYSSNPNDPKSLSDNFCRTIFEDQTGVVWIGTNNGGLNKFDLHRKKFKHYTQKLNHPYGLSNSHVFSIHEDKKGTIWIATRDGLNTFNKETERFTCYKHDPVNPNSLSHNYTHCVIAGESPYMWIGTDGGLNKLNTKTGAVQWYQYDPNNPKGLSNNNVRFLYFGRSGILWIGTWGGGLNKFIPETNQFTQYPIDAVNITHNVVVAILEDSNGFIWLGTYGKGLARFNPITEELTFFTADPDNPDKLQDNVVNTLLMDHQDQIWIGTAGGGLSKFNPQEEIFITYDMNDGLPSSEITSILEDRENNLWISTGKGISKFDRSKQSFTNFDIDDGLQAYVFYSNSSCISQTGEMYFGGTNGFNVFNPDSIMTNPFLPQVIISDFKILNKSVKIGQKINGRVILHQPISETNQIVLSHKEYVLSLEFAALHFASPLKNQYMYMLEGFDKDWIATDATRRFVSYTTLKPGHYTFQVKASNNDNQWNPDPVALGITILPPYWQTWWFRVGLVFVILLIAIGIHQYRIRRLEIGRRELEIQVADRTADLVVANRELESFAYSVSHDLRAPLRGMDGFSQALLDDYQDKLDVKGKDYLQRIQHASQRMGNLIDGLLKLSRLARSEMHCRNVNLSTMAESIFHEYQQIQSDRSVEFEVDPDMIVYGDPSLLRVMLNNFIDNAWKFTSRVVNAKIEFKLNREADEIVYYIRDNGVGFDMSYTEKLFEVFQTQHVDFQGAGIGLATVKRIVQKHGGKIWAEGEVGEGAIFFFTLSKKQGSETILPL